MMRGQPLSPHFHDGMVTFRYYDADAKRVTVIGEWNGWKPSAHRLREQAGIWQVSLPRPKRGAYAYKFLVEREAQSLWVGDPENLHRTPDGANGFYSQLEIND